jgi:16S rRNA (guanine(966)-N(2))-methyltransferase RsmD
MTVITGTAKGKPLRALRGDDTRPTSAALKEAMFSAVQFELEGAVVLDLFAGSGQLGIEALSRGARQAYFCENNPKAIAVIRENLEYTGLSERALVYRVPKNAEFRVPTSELFDTVFLDPPYERGIIARALPLVARRLSEDGVIVCEHEKGLALPESVGELVISRAYKNMTIYRRNRDENSNLPGQL